jgi:hypothetical protein
VVVLIAKFDRGYLLDHTVDTSGLEELAGKVNEGTVALPCVSFYYTPSFVLLNSRFLDQIIMEHWGRLSGNICHCAKS